MKVKDIMTSAVKTATPETTLEEIARMLVENDCGAIPVVRNEASGKPLGIVTDRDIVCRVVAAGRDPRGLTAADCMSSPCVTVAPTRAARRRVPDDGGEPDPAPRRRRSDGVCCGIVSQADVARRIADKAGEIVKEVSQPSRSASAVPGREQSAPMPH